MVKRITATSPFPVAYRAAGRPTTTDVPGDDLAGLYGQKKASGVLDGDLNDPPGLLAEGKFTGVR